MDDKQVLTHMALDLDTTLQSLRRWDIEGDVSEEFYENNLNDIDDAAMCIDDAVLELSKAYKILMRLRDSAQNPKEG